MRFHHSTRRGRTRHSSGHGAGSASSNSHGSSAAAARWALNYCRETNIHFNRRLPVEPPQNIAGGGSGGNGNGGATSNNNNNNSNNDLDDVWSPVEPFANAFNDYAIGGSDCHREHSQQQQLNVTSASQQQQNNNNHNVHYQHQSEINSDNLGTRMHLLRVRDVDDDVDDRVGSTGETTAANNHERTNELTTKTRLKSSDGQLQLQQEQMNKFRNVENCMLLHADAKNIVQPTTTARQHERRSPTKSSDTNKQQRQEHERNLNTTPMNNHDFTTTSGSMDMQAIRELLVNQVRKHPFWSNKAAKRMHLDFVERRRIYIYELVSFCERRQLEYRYEPYRGGLVQSVPFASSGPTPQQMSSSVAAASTLAATGRPCSPLNRLNRPEFIVIPRSLPGSPSASMDQGSGMPLSSNVPTQVHHQKRASSCQPQDQLNILMEEYGAASASTDTTNRQQTMINNRFFCIDSIGSTPARSELGPKPSRLELRNLMARSNSAATSSALDNPSGMMSLKSGQHQLGAKRGQLLSDLNNNGNNDDHQQDDDDSLSRTDSPRRCLNYSSEANYDSMMVNGTGIGTGSGSSAITPIGAIQRSLPSAEFVWSLPLHPKTLRPTPFKGYEHSSELPNSSFVKRCHGCQGKGRLKCKQCHGVGYEVCLACYGKGTTRNSHSGSRYRDSSSAFDGGGGCSRGGGGLVGGGAGISGGGGGINLASESPGGGGSGGGIDSISDSRGYRNDTYWSGSYSGGGGGSGSSSYLESCHMCHGAGQKRCWACAGSSYKFCPGCLGAGRLRCYLMLHIIFLNHRDESFLNNSDEIIPKERLRLVSGKCILEESAEQLKPFTSGRLIEALDAGQGSNSTQNKKKTKKNSSTTTIDEQNNVIDNSKCNSGDEQQQQQQQQQMNSKQYKKNPVQPKNQQNILSGSLNRLDDICLLQTTSDKLMKKHREIYRNERLIRQRHTITQIETDIVNYEWKRRSGKFAIYGDERKVYIGKYPYKSICNIT